MEMQSEAEQPSTRNWMGRWRRTLMTAAIGAALVFLDFDSRPAAADGAWLDQQPLANWNTAGAAIPAAPPPSEAFRSCPPSLTRGPQTEEDRQVVATGWRLLGTFEGGYGVMVVTGVSDLDGMCRPLGYQVFVFFQERFIGTISPVLMDSRSDGGGSVENLSGPLHDGIGPGSMPSLTATFARYRPEDGACCPSATSRVQFSLELTSRGWVLTPGAVTTTPNALR